MNKQRNIFAFCLCLLATEVLFAQDTNDEMTYYFENRVKSLYEFMARFNAEEIPPYLEVSDSALRRKCVFSLFDFQANGEKNDNFKDYVSFASYVDSNHYKLSYIDSLWYAEASCLMEYKGKEINLNIVLRYERIRDDFFRWCLVGVNGLLKNSILSSNIWGSISPIQHEVNFIELDGIINSDADNICGYVSLYTEISQLSYFVALVREKTLKFISCEGITYHFLNIPGYIFRVNEFNRKDENAGWLISHIQQCDDEVLDEYLKLLLGSKEN